VLLGLVVVGTLMPKQIASGYLAGEMEEIFWHEAAILRELQSAPGPVDLRTETSVKCKRNDRITFPFFPANTGADSDRIGASSASSDSVFQPQ